MSSTTTTPTGLTRRGALALLPALPAVPALLAAPRPAWAAGVRTDIVTVLYRKESTDAPNRLDPAVQAATLALEAEFLQRGFRIIQPTADAYRLLDQGPAVILTFATDAGFSLVFSAYKSMRGMPGADAGIAEVRLEARVFVGREVLVADDGRGQMMTRLDADNREFGERRAYELAARKAAADLVDKAATRLRELTPAQIGQMAQPLGGAGSVTGQLVPVPQAAKPPPPSPPPPPLSAPLSTPIPGPAPVPGAGPATAAAPAVVSAPPAAIAVADADLPPPAQRFALIVGVSDYGPTRRRLGITNPEHLSNLAGVAVDVNNFEKTLLDLGFPRKQVVTLRDETATGTNVRGILKQFARDVGKDDMVVIFLSGHGASKDQSYSGYGRPILADDGGDKDANTLDFWELQGLTRNLPCSRVLWVIDTCFSGNAARQLVTAEMSSSGVNVSPGATGPDAKVVTAVGDPGKHFAVVTASRGTEVSLDTPKGGLFTQYFLEGVRRASGRQPLDAVMSSAVVPPVLEYSRDVCRRAGPRCAYPQQTPELGYTGRGNKIRL